MPMGPYKDFSTCLIAQRKKGHSEDIAAKICGFIKKKTEGSINEEEAEKEITRLETASWIEQEVLSTREIKTHD